MFGLTMYMDRIKKERKTFVKPNFPQILRIQNKCCSIFQKLADQGPVHKAECGKDCVEVWRLSDRVRTDYFIVQLFVLLAKRDFRF